MDRFEAMGKSLDQFGSALTAMSNFEMDSGYLRMRAPAAVGRVMQSVGMLVYGRPGNEHIFPSRGLMLRAVRLCGG